MEHLLYVLWHDCWKPWLRNLLLDITYILGAALLVLGIGLGLIYMTIEVGKALGG